MKIQFGYCQKIKFSFIPTIYFARIAYIITVNIETTLQLNRNLIFLSKRMTHTVV